MPLNATNYFSTASGVDTCIYKLLSRIVVNLCVGESCSTLHLFIYRLSIFFYRSFRMFDNLQKRWLGLKNVIQELGLDIGRFFNDADAFFDTFVL